MPPLTSPSPEKVRPPPLAPHHSPPASVLPLSLSARRRPLSSLSSLFPYFQFQ
ncbi:hypothetical protein A2U01_0111505, partial [Trifolium medium]|nr:hypothetical protein [Trifolium medium]